MYLVREVMYCKPGKVRDMVNKFKAVSGVMQRMGLKPFRVFTDVSGERFWTVAAETEVESLNAFIESEGRVMSDPEAQKIMTGYHDLIQGGRREVYRVES